VDDATWGPLCFTIALVPSADPGRRLYRLLVWSRDVRGHASVRLGPSMLRACLCALLRMYASPCACASISVCVCQVRARLRLFVSYPH
jgi:hypothetical protein